MSELVFDVTSLAQIRRSPNNAINAAAFLILSRFRSTFPGLERSTEYDEDLCSNDIGLHIIIETDEHNRDLSIGRAKRTLIAHPDDVVMIINLLPVREIHNHVLGHIFYINGRDLIRKELLAIRYNVDLIRSTHHTTDMFDCLSRLSMEQEKMFSMIKDLHNTINHSDMRFEIQVRKLETVKDDEKEPLESSIEFALPSDPMDVTQTSIQIEPIEVTQTPNQTEPTEDTNERPVTINYDNEVNNLIEALRLAIEHRTNFYEMRFRGVNRLMSLGSVLENLRYSSRTRYFFQTGRLDAYRRRIDDINNIMIENWNDISRHRLDVKIRQSNGRSSTHRCFLIDQPLTF